MLALSSTSSREWRAHLNHLSSIESRSFVLLFFFSFEVAERRSIECDRDSMENIVRIINGPRISCFHREEVSCTYILSSTLRTQIIPSIINVIRDSVRNSFHRVFSFWWQIWHLTVHLFISTRMVRYLSFVDVCGLFWRRLPLRRFGSFVAKEWVVDTHFNETDVTRRREKETNTNQQRENKILFYPYMKTKRTNLWQKFV